MKDLGGLMKQAQAMQQKLADAQARLAETTVDGTSGGGMVTVTLMGNGELVRVLMDESLVQPGEGEVIADLIIAAHADAKKKLDAEKASKAEASSKEGTWEGGGQGRGPKRRAEPRKSTKLPSTATTPACTAAWQPE